MPMIVPGTAKRSEVDKAGAAPDVASRIACQLEASVPELAGVKSLRRLTGGSSHETWAFDARLGGATEFTPLILRREFELALFEMPLATEFELVRMLRRSGFPVPEPHFVSTSASGTEAPFMVMERVAGLDTRKAMAANPAPGERRAIAAALVDALAALHGLPIAPFGELLGIGTPAGELEKWQAIVLGSGCPSAALRLAVAWLEQRCPPVAEQVIVHGDFKANNVLLRQPEQPVVIDWELAHLGDRLEDLAWTMLWTTRDDIVGGMLTPAAFLAEYERASGHSVDRDRLHFWKVFALVKLAAIFLKGLEPGPTPRAPRPMLLMLAQALPCIEEALAALLSDAPRWELAP